MSKQVTIDFHYLDLSTCKRCQGTEQALDAVIARHPELDLSVLKKHMQTAVEAITHRFAISPTLRVNGRDIQPDYKTSECGECGDLECCSGGVGCRVWTWDGEDHLAAPEGLIEKAIVEAAAA